MLSQVVKKACDLHFWMSFMGVKDTFLSLGNFRLHNGNQIRFWVDIWLGYQPLKFQYYPTLFNIVRRKHAKVAVVLGWTPLNVEFRRALLRNKLLEWNHLVARAKGGQL